MDGCQKRAPFTTPFQADLVSLFSFFWQFMSWTKSAELTLHASDKNRPFQEFQLQSRWKRKNKEGKTSPKEPKGTIFSTPLPFSTPHKAELPVSIEIGASLLFWDPGKQLLEELPSGHPYPTTRTKGNVPRWHGVAEGCIHYSLVPRVCSHFGICCTNHLR